MTPTDDELIHDYVRDRSAAAFTTLVDRHLNLVYSVARRHVRSAALGEEVAQSVFIDLAREAGRIKPGTPLVAWLHLVARRSAIDVVRREARRQSREQEAAQLADVMKTPEPSWTEVEPLLDEAVESLTEPDRTAILLRYFENKSLREVGAALGTSDDAAQKRVSRALEALRAFFLRRGVAIGSGLLAHDLSAHALYLAPAGLGTSISSAALFTGTGATATVAASRFLAMTTLQKSLAVAVLVTLGGTGWYEARLVARQAEDIAAWRERHARASADLRELQRAAAAASARREETERRIDALLAAAIPASAADAALEAQMQQWLEQADRMKAFLASRPQWNIPELQSLSDREWFEAAATEKFESDEQIRRATSRLRDLAVSRAQWRIFPALKSYLADHGDVLPARAEDLAPYVNPPLDPAILARYEMLQRGKASDVPKDQASAILAPPPADPEFDAYLRVGLNGYAMNNGTALVQDVRDAQKRYAAANNGASGATAEQLLPYLKWPVSAEALQKFLQARARPNSP